MRRNPWWYAPPKYGPVAVFQLVLGGLMMLVVWPMAIVCTIVCNWVDNRRNP